MLHTTLRQMASISGRAILAIGLASATVLALAPSAKAEDVTVSNPAYRNIDSYVAGSAPAPSSGSITSATVGTLNVSANALYKINVKSTVTGKEGKLVNGTNEIAYTLKVGSGTAAAVTGTDAAFYNAATALEAANGLPLTVKIDTGSTDFRTLAVGSYTDTLAFSIAAP